MTIKFQYIFTIAFFTISLQTAWAQKKDENLGTEVINVVKPYTPTISDAFKVKETPSLDDEDNTKKEEIKYNIFSFPVASTFTPAKGKAANVDKSKQEKLFNNFASIGIGNYGTLNAELFVTENLNRNEYVGGMLRHQSSQGGIKEVDLNDKFYNTQLDLTYGNQQQNMSWNADLGYQHQIYNWYGLPKEFVTFDPATVDAIAPEQTYHTFYVGGRLETKESLFNEVTLQYKRFWDAKGSAENRFFVKPSLEFDILGEKIKTLFVVDYVGGTFERNYFTAEALKYGYTNIGIQPSFVIQRDDLSINLGAGIFYSMDNQNSRNKFYVYPQVTASYKVVGDLMIAYAGAEGKLRQNSYRDLMTENQFISPTIGIAPTDQQYDLYVGLKGKLANNIGYNVRGSLLNEKNKALFMSNTYAIGAAPLEEGYMYGNSFNVVYDDVRTVSLFGELKFDMSKAFSLGVNGTFNSFKTDRLEEAYNLPEFKFGANMDVKITEKWFAGANVFFVGERKDMFSTSTSISQMAQTVTLDSYFDANLHVGYQYNERLTAFLRANNLANQAYQKWMNYPVQQFQIVVGASYKFDF
ncbi:TonB-dependent receptor [Flavobacterium sp. '19STA2R22 D10 B1']|uniref:TonB-dependent receptor n=1 Tax=Flavobacterium aerium TaxID=3037261 RepID=UPI00278BEF94|nr:TonB-dependent receptor [Flavobacterium sp. '19STA2R22 D10 B1']